MALWLPTLGVVPILVNVGAPLLPALIGGLLAFFTALGRPRELIAMVRRNRIRSVTVVLSFCAAMGIWQVTAKPAPPATDWAEVARGILAAQPASASSRLTPGWRYRPEGSMILAAPTSASGRVYGASALVDVAGNFGSIFCLDAQTGEPIWQVESIAGRDLKAIYSSPVLSEDGRSVIVGEGLHYDKDCALVCLDSATGELRWRVPTPLHVESSPAVRGDLVVVGVGAIEPGGHAPTTGEGYVLAVRISDGRELWRYPLVDVESSPAIGGDGTIYVGSGIGGNAVVALDDEGNLLWKSAAPSPVTGPITLDGETIYAGAGRGDMVHGSSEPEGAVLALDRASGAERWQAPMPDAVLGRVVVGEGKVICPVRNGELIALDLRDGAVLWRQRISGSAPLLANPVLEGDRIYAVSGDGVLAVLALADGAILEKHLLNAANDPGRRGLGLSSPVVVGGRVFVGSETGGLRSFELVNP